MLLLTDVKQRRIFSPVSVPKSQSVDSTVIVSAQSSESCEKTSVKRKPDNLSASVPAAVGHTEEMAYVVGKRQLIDSLVASSVAESVSQLSLQSDADAVPPTDGNGPDAELQQQSAIKSETSATAGSSITSNDASVRDSEGHGSSLHPAAAVQGRLQQQVAVNRHNAEASSEDSPSQTSRDASRVSAYQTDVAVYKQEAKTDDGAGGKQEAWSGSTSDTFTSCVHASPAGSDSVFHSPQSDISANKNTDRIDSLFVQQAVPHSLRDTVSSPDETKVMIYSRSDDSTARSNSSTAGLDSFIAGTSTTTVGHDSSTAGATAGANGSIIGPDSSIVEAYSSAVGCNSSTAGERRKTGGVSTRSMLAAEKKRDKDVLVSHSESSRNVKSEKAVERAKDKHTEIDKDDDDDDDDDKECDAQKQTMAVNLKMAIESQSNETESYTSGTAETKSEKKKNKHQVEQTQFTAVAKMVPSSIEAETVEHPLIKRPPQMQQETMDVDGQTESEATQSATSAENRTLDSDANANANDVNGAVKREQKEASTIDACTEHQVHEQVTSSPGTKNMQEFSCSIPYRKSDKPPEEYQPAKNQR